MDAGGDNQGIFIFFVLTGRKKGSITTSLVRTPGPRVLPPGGSGPLRVWSPDLGISEADQRRPAQENFILPQSRLLSSVLFIYAVEDCGVNGTEDLDSFFSPYIFPPEGTVRPLHDHQS